MEKQDIIDRVFGWVETAAQNVGDFATEQIPPFIEEFLTWRFFEAGFDVASWLVGLVILIILAIITKRSHTKYEGFSRNNGDPKVSFFWVVGCIVIMITLIPTFFAIALPSAKDMLQIKVAPKVYLVEEAAKMIKANGGSKCNTCK